MKADVGQFGGVVVVQFQSGAELLRPGHVIQPDDALAIPIGNRCALGRAGLVVWHDAPQPEMEADRP